MKTFRLLAPIVLLASLMQGCSGRQCYSHVTEGAYSEHCGRECLSRDKYYQCLCERNCICWSSTHPDSP